MNRIDRLFTKRSQNVLSLFYTAGYPELDSTVSIGKALSGAGVQMLEIGFPFSDSLVDGPTIQIANEKALAAGMNFTRYFKQIKELRREVDTPIVSMCCLNPILQMGFENYARNCAESGVDAVLIADLPPEELVRKYLETLEKYSLGCVLLLTSHATEARIRYLDSIATSFLYVVSSDATTGESFQPDDQSEGYFARLRQMALKNPLVVGFGIRDKESFSAACEHTDGAIIGSAFLRALSEKKDSETVAKEFVGRIVG